MKNISGFLTAFAAVCFLLSGCQEKTIDYDGPAFVLFSDSLYTYPVWENDNDYFEIVVGTSRPFGHDRWIGVEIVDALSSAVEGVDYVLEENNVLIKAGQYTGSLKIRADYEEIGDGDGKYVTVRLVGDGPLVEESYNTQARIVLRRAVSWTTDDLVEDGGHYLLHEYVSGGTYRIVRAEKLDENRIQFHNYIGNGRNMAVRIIDRGDIFTYDVEVLPQYIINIEDTGWARVRSVSTASSYFHPHLRAFTLNLEIYVEGIGIYGVYPFTMLWVSAEEAQYLIDTQGITDNYN